VLVHRTTISSRCASGRIQFQIQFVPGTRWHDHCNRLSKNIFYRSRQCCNGSVLSRHDSFSPTQPDLATEFRCVVRFDFVQFNIRMGRLGSHFWNIFDMVTMAVEAWSLAQVGFTVINSPDFIFLPFSSPHRSVSTECLPENWQENKGKRICSSPCRFLFRPQTRLPTSGDSSGRRVPYPAHRIQQRSSVSSSDLVKGVQLIAVFSFESFSVHNGKRPTEATFTVPIDSSNRDKGGLMKRQKTGKFEERSERQICCEKRQGFAFPMARTAVS